MYYILTGYSSTSVFFSTSIDGNIWTNWVTGPMSGGTSFAIATKNILPSINTIPTSIGPTGPTGMTGPTGPAPRSTYYGYSSVLASLSYISFTSASININIDSSISATFSGLSASNAGCAINLINTNITPTNTSTYLINLNFTYTTNGYPIYYTICRQSSGGTGPYYNSTSVYNNLAFTNVTNITGIYMAYDPGTSATATISITVTDTVQNTTPFIYTLWAFTTSGTNNTEISVSTALLSISQLTP